MTVNTKIIEKIKGKRGRPPKNKENNIVVNTIIQEKAKTKVEKREIGISQEGLRVFVESLNALEQGMQEVTKEVEKAKEKYGIGEEGFLFEKRGEKLLKEMESEIKIIYHEQFPRIHIHSKVELKKLKEASAEEKGKQKEGFLRYIRNYIYFNMREERIPTKLKAWKREEEETV